MKVGELELYYPARNFDATYLYTVQKTVSLDKDNVETRYKQHTRILQKTGSDSYATSRFSQINKTTRYQKAHSKFSTCKMCLQIPTFCSPYPPMLGHAVLKQNQNIKSGFQSGSGNGDQHSTKNKLVYSER